jgi:lysozyme family protein
LAAGLPSKLPAGLDLCLFDESVDAGAHEAIRLLQAALGIGADGAWGPQTGAAVKAIANVAGAVGNYTARHEAFYRELSGFRYFGTDWIRRSQETGAEALKMAASS